MTFKFGPSHFSLVVAYFLLSKAPNWPESEGEKGKMILVLQLRVGKVDRVIWIPNTRIADKIISVFIVSYIWYLDEWRGQLTAEITPGIPETAFNCEQTQMGTHCMRVSKMSRT